VKFATAVSPTNRDDPPARGPALPSAAELAAFRATQDGLRAIQRNVPAMIGYWDRDLRNRLTSSTSRSTC
jgi:hypothetical protein